MSWLSRDIHAQQHSVEEIRADLGCYVSLVKIHFQHCRVPAAWFCYWMLHCFCPRDNNGSLAGESLPLAGWLVTKSHHGRYADRYVPSYVPRYCSASSATSVSSAEKRGAGHFPKAYPLWAFGATGTLYGLASEGKTRSMSCSRFAFTCT